MKTWTKTREGEDKLLCKRVGIDDKQPGSGQLVGSTELIDLVGKSLQVEGQVASPENLLDLYKNIGMPLEYVTCFKNQLFNGLCAVNRQVVKQLMLQAGLLTSNPD